MEELKPCPFCGGEAKLIYAKVQDWYMPVCKTSGCPASNNGANTVTLAKEAIEAWNKRI